MMMVMRSTWMPEQLCLYRFSSIQLESSKRTSVISINLQASQLVLLLLTKCDALNNITVHIFGDFYFYYSLTMNVYILKVNNKVQSRAEIYFQILAINMNMIRRKYHIISNTMKSSVTMASFRPKIFYTPNCIFN